ncbi:uncharacterized protein TNCV_2265141 [Trichonephila clavipes]|nr:uncharacterized protein TNCV_2265141 [Trichonephila clavipes]
MEKFAQSPDLNLIEHVSDYLDKYVGLARKSDKAPSQCIVPLRHGGTLNSRRAASPLAWLVEREERWPVHQPPQDFLSQNWGGAEQNRAVTCRVLKVKVKDRCNNSSP